MSAQLTALISAPAGDAWAVANTVMSLFADWPEWRVVVHHDSPALDDLAFIDGCPRVCGQPGEIVGGSFPTACLHAAEGRHAVLFLSAGDTVRKGCAETLAGLFGPLVGAAVGDWTESGRRVYCEPFDRRRMAEAPWLPQAALVSTEALQTVGPPAADTPAAWLDFWFRLTDRYVAVHTPQTLADLKEVAAATSECFQSALRRAVARA